MNDKNKYTKMSKELRNKHKSQLKKVRHGKVSVFFAAAILCIVVAASVIASINLYHPVDDDSPVSSEQSSAKTVKAITPNKKDQTKSPVKTTNRIVVLMYHSINREKNNDLRVPKEYFAAEMKWLYDNGYNTLSLDELYDAVLNDKPIREKSVVLTFDDGYSDNYRSAFPIIKKYHFKATVFMITGYIGKVCYLTADELKEMDRNGFRVECHTVTHPDLSTLSYKNQYSQLLNSKNTLEKLLSHKISYMAYPSGMYNSSTIEAAERIGYKMCFRMKGGVGKLSGNRYEFPRAFVGQDLSDFIKRVKGTANYSM